MTLNKYKAAEGKALPVKVNGVTRFITEDVPMEVDLSTLDHQSCIHFQQALRNNEIMLVEADLPKPKIKKGE